MLFDQKQQQKERIATSTILKDLWVFMTPLRRDIFVAFLLIFLMQVLTFVQPMFWKQAVDAIVQKESLGMLAQIFYVLAGVAIIQSILGYVRQTQAHHFRWKSRMLLEYGGFEKLLSFSIGQHIEQGSGVKFAIYQNGVTGFTNMIQQLLYDVLPALFTLLVTIIVLFFLSWELACLMLLLVMVRLWADIRYARKYVKQPMKTMTSKIVERWAHMKEIAREVETVKQFGREAQENLWLRSTLDKIRELSNSIWITSMKHNAIRQTVFQLAYFGILFLGVYFIYIGRFTPGYILLFFSWGGMVVSAVRDLTNFERDFIDHLVNAEKLLEMLRKESVIKDNEHCLEIENPKGYVRFEKVDFFYKEALERLRAKQEGGAQSDTDFSLPLFQELTLDIPAGKTVALVGHSGSGKTTLIKLLQRYYDVTGGQILFDGIDIRNLSLESLRTNIGIVPQDVRLFDGTLRENILYGVGNTQQVTEDEIQKVVRMSCISAFMERLPKGLDTNIGENGIKLSGGEKQRVGIARALLKDPSVLIFDEATSSLDSENERLIQQAIKEVAQGRTTIIVAHRLSTIIHADKIVVLEKGNIVGEGTHRELMKDCSQYKHLVTIQMKDLLSAQIGEVSEGEVNSILKSLRVLE